MPRSHFSALAVAFSVLFISGVSARAAEPLRVAGAISLRESLERAAAEFERERNIRVELTFGSSGALLTQARNGAPFDVFVSAAHKQVDELSSAGLVAGSRVVVACNRLVLIASKDEPNPPESFEALRDAKFSKLTIGDPATVPAGHYAQETLRALKLEEALRDRLVYGANVRQSLAYVEQRATPLGIVYATDARQAGDAVRVLAVADAAWHSPIEYPAVILKNTKQADAARAFIEFLLSDAGRRILREHGFDPPGSEKATPATQPASRPAVGEAP